MGKIIMPDQFLYEMLDAASKMRLLKRDVPNSIRENLSPKFELRPYQEEAFARFLYCYKEFFPGQSYPFHFLFNMATGSGKTLIMAGLILYLYEQGHRNFLFFVNSTNIIEKTKDNFLNPSSIKYLFNSEIQIADRRIHITPVDNFEGADPQGINICFTTIQKLHSDLTNAKENSLTYEDFRKYRVVMLADEAHHMNVSTKSQQELFDSWENTVERIFKQHRENLLLEFTATHDYETPEMVEKYRNTVIIRYDLQQFRNDRFSKDVVLVSSDFNQRDRILQALVLSEYKQLVAAKHGINLKPVILFKAQKTIAQSEEVKTEFHTLVERLTSSDIARVRTSQVEVIQRAFLFFANDGILDSQLVRRLKYSFQEEHCLSVNQESEKERYQVLVNTLEDPQNRIRAIFAVQKLNEGWDVLNLFDIVRCYEARDTGRREIGTTTLSEAQLIGRGARYFPFTLPAYDDRFRRKFDADLSHEMRVLEELHYHSINDSRYITEIRQALRAKGMMDDREVTKEFKLKESFKRTPFFKTGIVWLNKRIPKDYSHVRTMAGIGVSRRNYRHTIATGQGNTEALLEKQRNGTTMSDEQWDTNIKAINRNIIQSALSRNPFFTFSNLQKYFPHLNSIKTFIDSNDYLGGLEITFQGASQRSVNRLEQLRAVQGLLTTIESEIRSDATEFEGSPEFIGQYVHEVFSDKLMRFDKDNPRARDDSQFETFISSRDWVSFTGLYGTSEEKELVRLLDRQMRKLQKDYQEIYLLRNEGHFAIYAFDDGARFEPDFALFLRQNDGELLTYQLFIEPKGRFIEDKDQWKNAFLKEISERFSGKVFKLDSKRYRLRGIPFFNSSDENEFVSHFYASLEEPNSIQS